MIFPKLPPPDFTGPGDREPAWRAHTIAAYVQQCMALARAELASELVKTIGLLVDSAGGEIRVHGATLINPPDRIERTDDPATDDIVFRTIREARDGTNQQ